MPTLEVVSRFDAELRTVGRNSRIEELRGFSLESAQGPQARAALATA
jgi:hypothetical protein